MLYTLLSRVANYANLAKCEDLVSLPALCREDCLIWLEENVNYSPNRLFSRRLPYTTGPIFRHFIINGLPGVRDDAPYTSTSVF